MTKLKATIIKVEIIIIICFDKFSNKNCVLSLFRPKQGWAINCFQAINLQFQFLLSIYIYT